MFKLFCYGAPSRSSLAVGCLLFLAGSVCLSADRPQNYAEFDAALDIALEERDADYASRLQLAADVYAAFSQSLQVDDPLLLKARYVEALANMRVGEFELSTRQTESLCSAIPPESQPSLRFRCGALAAYLLLVRGNKEESLSVYRALFSDANEGVDEALVTRAKIGYAVVLNENGRSAEAVDMYEQALISAIRSEDDMISLYAGNNLIVILIDLKDYRAARQTLDQLAPMRARNPNTIVSGSLVLHDMELERLAGHPDRAAAGLHAFIDEGTDKTPLMLGSSHHLLAESLRDLGELDAAAYHGQQAVELLADQAHEVTDARLSLTETLVQQGKYAEATAMLANIDPSVEPVPSTLVDYGRLSLMSRLLTLGDEAALRAFDDFVAAHAQRDAVTSTTRAEYFEARLKVSEQEFALQKAEESARFAALQRERENLTNRLLLAFVVAVSVLVVMLIAMQLRRNAEKRLLAEKVRLNQQVEQNKRFEAIGMLAGNVAHDFNNLLQVVASSNETLRNKANEKDQDSLSAIELSEQALDYGTRIVRQLLTFSKSKELEAKPISFSDYLEQTRSLLASALGEERRLRTDDGSENTAILVDPTQLTTSLLNLIRNSVDAMPEGGEVVLSATVVELADDERDWAPEVDSGRYLQVALADTGTGMNETVLERAIEPFFTTKGKQSGSGLGLSSVYAFARQSGGDLRIDSQPGRGTAVELLLPIVDVPTDEVAKARQPQQSLSRELRLLMVEDNEMLAVALKKNLVALDADVVHVTSADQAQEWLSAADPQVDVLLTDIRMPGKINGLDLARWAKQRFPALKVVLMSGYIDQDAAPLEFQVIRKPFRLFELAAAIRDGESPSAAAGS